MNYTLGAKLVRFNSGSWGIILWVFCSIFMTLPFFPDVRGSSKTAGKLQSSAPASWSCIVWKWRKWRFAKVKERFTSKLWRDTYSYVVQKEYCVFQMIYCSGSISIQSTLLRWCFPSSLSVYAHRQTWLSKVGLLSQPVYIKMSEALFFVM